MQCVILAGGLGSRMWPLTQGAPKVLLPAAGQPFLSHQLQLLAGHGIRDVVLSIGHHGDSVREYAGDGRRWGVRVRYSDDGDQLRGTGGALRLAADRHLLDDRFLLLYGDSFTPISFADVEAAFHRQQRPALMVILRNDDRWDRSNVLMRGNALLVYDKTRTDERSGAMRHIDYGVAILTRKLIEAEIPQGRSDLADLYYRLSLQGELGSFEVEDRFYEIGSKAGLTEFERYIGSRQLERTGANA